jgi:hypothetical protein
MAVRFTKISPFTSVLFAVAALSSEGFGPPTDTSVNTSDELETVMAEGTDPARINRRPGFSEITYAQSEEAGREIPEYSDQTPAQAGEAELEPDQR